MSHKEAVAAHYAPYYESVANALDKKAVLKPLMYLTHDYREGFKAVMNMEHPRNQEGTAVQHNAPGTHTNFIWRNSVGTEMSVTTSYLESNGYMHIVVLYAEVGRPVIIIERFVEGLPPYSPEQSELACAMLSDVFDRLWPTPA